MQNRVSLPHALGTCWGSAALAAPSTTADLVGVLLAELAVGDPVRAGGLTDIPVHGRPSASVPSGCLSDIPVHGRPSASVPSGGLSLFPLTARDALREPATRVVTLGEALERAWLTFRVDRAGTGAAPFRASPWASVTRSVTGAVDSADLDHPWSGRVLLQSWADAAILITAGETLPGCGGLAAVRDVLVPPGARGLGIPAASTPGASAFGDERSWRHRVRALEAIAAGFPSGCEGVLLAVGDRAVRLELFPTAWLLSRVRPNVLRAAAFEAPAGQEGPPMCREDAERFLRQLSNLPWMRRVPVGLGLDAEGSVPGLAASALFLGGALVHLSADARGGRLLLAAPGQDPEPIRP